jgi:thioredoxin 1
MTVAHINTDKFQAEVIEYKDGPVFVDFYADWCGPCRITAPIIEELAKEVKGVKFVKIDVDKNPDLATSYSVFSIPTFLLVKNGKIISQMVGAQSKEGFLQEIKKAAPTS